MCAARRALRWSFPASTGASGYPRRQRENKLPRHDPGLRLLGIEELEERDVPTLSHGQVRMLLILRAIVTGPRMLVLDEPMSGLDREARSILLPVFGNLTAMSTALVYVTHKKHELLPSISHVAVLKKGEIVFQGLKNEWEELQAT